MATIIDSIVLTLGADPARSVDGHRKADTADGHGRAERALRRTLDAAKKQAAAAEEANSAFSTAFNAAKVEAAAFFVVVAAVKAIAKFTADITQASSALGRLSANLSVSPEELAAWGAALERVGGSAEEAASDFKAISAQLFDLKQNGKSIPPEIQKMAAAAHVPININGGIGGYLGSIGKAAAELTRLHGGDRSDSFNFLTHAGIGPGMAQVLIDNGAQLDKFIGSLKDLSPTDDQIKKFESLQTSFVDLRLEATEVGREIAADVSPAITGVLDALDEIIRTNETSWTCDAVSGVKNLIDALKEIKGVDKWERDPDGNIKTVHGGPLSDFFKWFGDNWGVKGAHAGTLDGLTPGRGNSGPHTAPGLAVEGNAVSRGNPMPVTLVQSETVSSGSSFWSWMYGGLGMSPQPAGGSSGEGASVEIHAWWTPERMSHAAERLEKEAGLSPTGAAGLIARWAAIESPGGPTAMNLNGAEGINQARSDRRPEGYAKMSLDQQLDYIVKDDLRAPAQRRAYDVLKNAKTPAEAAAGAAMYERAEGFNGVGDNSTASTLVQATLNAIAAYRASSRPALPHRPITPTPAQHLATLSALHPIRTVRASSRHIDRLDVYSTATTAQGIAADIHAAIAARGTA